MSNGKILRGLQGYLDYLIRGNRLMGTEFLL
jgi:hypothetical protein